MRHLRRPADKPLVPTFLDSAPASLRYLYSITGVGKDKLHRLLTDRAMAKAWTILAGQAGSTFRNQRFSVRSPNEPYRRLWANIVQLLLSKPERKPSEIAAELNDIMKNAKALRQAIVDPDRDRHPRPRSLPSKTGARFDYRPLYEYFPQQVMRINMQGASLRDDAWAKADDLERSSIAYRLLLAWPTFSEVLDELIAHIERERARESSRRRSVKRERKARSGDSTTKDRSLVVGLTEYLEQDFGMTRDDAIAVTGPMATAVLGKNILKDFIRKALRGK